MKEHNLTSDDLKKIPELLANPEYVFESKTDEKAFVAIVDKNIEPYTVVVSYVGNGLKIKNIIKSAYNKDTNFIKRETNAGRLLYDKKKPMEIRQHRASIAQAFIPSDTSNITSSGRDVNITFNQPGFVSMKTELVGDYLDADRFEGTGEGNAAHGWGNYALQDRETNKINYFSWMSKKELFLGDEVISVSPQSPYKTIQVGLNNNWSKDFIKDGIKELKKRAEKQIEEHKERLKELDIRPEEYEQWQNLLKEKSSYNLFSQRDKRQDVQNKIFDLLKYKNDANEYDWIARSPKILQ